MSFFTASFLMGCGEAPKPIASQQPSPTQTPRPTTSIPTFPRSNFPALPYPTANLLSDNEIQLLSGTYDAEVHKQVIRNGFPISLANSSQDFTLSILQAKVEGQLTDKFLYYRFNSSGNTYGPIAFEQFFSINPASFSMLGNFKIYTLLSEQSVSFSNLSEHHFTIEVTLAFENGNKFDPGQSKIRFLVCPFSGGTAVCFFELDDVRSGYIRKR